MGTDGWMVGETGGGCGVALCWLWDPDLGFCHGFNLTWLPNSGEEEVSASSTTNGVE